MSLKILYKIFIFLFLVKSFTLYAQFDLSVNTEYRHDKFVYQKEMIFAVHWGYSGFFPVTDRAIGMTSRLYSSNNFSDLRNLSATIFDLGEILPTLDYSLVQNVWYSGPPACVFKRDAFKIQNFCFLYLLELIDSVAVKKYMASKWHIVFPILAHSKITLPVSDPVQKNILSYNDYYNELYLFKCKVTYFTGDDLILYIPRLKSKRSDIFSEWKSKNKMPKYYREMRKGITLGKFDQEYNSDNFKVHVNYIFDVSDISIVSKSDFEKYLNTFSEFSTIDKQKILECYGRDLLPDIPNSSRRK